MFRSWKFIILMIVSTFILTACSQSLEERVSDGIKASEEVFFGQEETPNEEIEGVKLYKPMDFTVKESSDAQNIIFKTKNETFILFINPNEETNSRLFYDLLVADQSKKIIDEKTFIEDDIFGFVAVIEGDNDSVELISSVGGAKLTTLSSEKKIADHLPLMTKIVRSIQLES